MDVDKMWKKFDSLFNEMDKLFDGFRKELKRGGLTVVNNHFEPAEPVTPYQESPKGRSDNTVVIREDDTIDEMHIYNCDIKFERLSEQSYILHVQQNGNEGLIIDIFNDSKKHPVWATLEDVSHGKWKWDEEIHLDDRDLYSDE